MDIDVKNAYQKVERACSKNDQKALVEDIYDFISFISVTGALERFISFYKTYVHADPDYNPEDVLEKPLPKERKIVDSLNPRAVSELIQFFSVLGKYYVFNRNDKEYIDKDKFVQYIRQLQSDYEKKIESIREASIKKAEHEGNDHSNNAKDVFASGAGGDGQAAVTEKNKADTLEKPVEATETEPEKTVEELLAELHSMIGLDGVKKEVDQITKMIRVQKKGEEFGEAKKPLSLHLVFYGNPGTGKTTVARLLARIYKALGVLSRGQLVEVDRGKLVGGYVGQTAIKTQEEIDKAIGGILFVDEAYTLTHGKGDTDFGQEAVDTILKAMEDHRDDLIVIVAGYPDLMKEFISSNPGLESRFNQYINFEDYTPKQLREIFRFLCKDHNRLLEDGCEEYLLDFFTMLYENRTSNFANGRDVRNYFERVERMHADRISSFLDSITKEQFVTITKDDLVMAKEEFGAF